MKLKLVLLYINSIKMQIKSFSLLVYVTVSQIKRLDMKLVGIFKALSSWAMWLNFEDSNLPVC
jgi:hypothetical protein